MSGVSSPTRTLRGEMNVPDERGLKLFVTVTAPVAWSTERRDERPRREGIETLRHQHLLIGADILEGEMNVPDERGLKLGAMLWNENKRSVEAR